VAAPDVSAWRDSIVAVGLPKENIVLGFQPPESRKWTDFAVA
jgi:hypothetical protein